MELECCQIFTPTDTVNYMLNMLGYDEDIFGKTVIDNSCGNGNFLVEIVHRFILDGKRKRASSKIIKEQLEKCIYGYEIDEKVYLECLDNLNEVVKKYNITNIKWNVVRGDGLYIDKDGSFDYVVGNPPYVAYVNLDTETRKLTRQSFISCSEGKFDYSYAFIEKGLKLLKPDGKMIMITPSNMFKTVFGRKLREIIKPNITHIIDCSALNIFHNVLTSPAITLYCKDSNTSSIVYMECKVEFDGCEKIISKNTIAEKWDFTEYIEDGERRFGDYFKVSNSIATLANNVFIHRVDKQGNLDIAVEEEILRVAVSPKARQFDIEEKIIFPYDYENGVLVRYCESYMELKFPRALEYLNSQKDILIKRDSDKSAKWYEFGRSQALSHINCEKLLLSSIVTKAVKIYKLKQTEIPYSGLYIIPKKGSTLDEAILILTTKRFFEYIKSKGIKVSGESLRISSKDIEEYRY